MKKLFLMIALLATLGTLTACGGGGSNEPEVPAHIALFDTSPKWCGNAGGYKSHLDSHIASASPLPADTYTVLVKCNDGAIMPGEYYRPADVPSGSTQV